MISRFNLFASSHKTHSKRKDYDRSDFADFFVHAPAKEQKRVIKHSVQAANREQADLITRARELTANP